MLIADEKTNFEKKHSNPGSRTMLNKSNTCVLTVPKHELKIR